MRHNRLLTSGILSLLNHLKLPVLKDHKWPLRLDKLVNAMYLSKEHQAQVRGLHLQGEVLMVAQTKWRLLRLPRVLIASMKRNLAMQVQGVMKDFLMRNSQGGSCPEKAQPELWKSKMMASRQIHNLVF